MKRFDDFERFIDEVAARSDAGVTSDDRQRLDAVQGALTAAVRGIIGPDREGEASLLTLVRPEPLTATDFHGSMAMRPVLAVASLGAYRRNIEVLRAALYGADDRPA